MLRSVVAYSFVGLTLIFITPHMLWLKRLRGRIPDADYYKKTERVTRWWARTLVKASGARMYVSGQEHIPTDRPVLFVANHQSDFDVVLFLAYAPVPIGFIAKTEMLKVPLLRTWIDLIGSVFLDRHDIKKGAKAILAGIEKLKGGHTMALFPEGTRSKSDEMQAFRAGGFKLATKPRVPVVPVTISGSYKVMEGNGYIVTPADVYLTFHPAVPTEGLEGDALAALPRQVEDTIRNGLLRKEC